MVPLKDKSYTRSWLGAFAAPDIIQHDISLLLCLHVNLVSVNKPLKHCNSFSARQDGVKCQRIVCFFTDALVVNL